MRVRLAVLAGLAVCAVVQAAPPQFGELIEVNVVNVDVLVTDRAGRPVTDSHSGDGREHTIEVRVKRPRLQVRHRKSYRDKPAIERAVDKTLSAVYHGFEENPLDVTLEMGAQRLTEGSLVSVPIKLRIPLFKLGIFPQPDGTFRGRLRLLVSTRDAKGGVSPIRQVEVPLQIPPEEVLYAMGKFYEYELTLNLPPGEQHVAIAVWDEGTATTSVLSRTLDVEAGLSK